MVFHEIDTITDVRSGYRTIIYYLENRTEMPKVEVSKRLETAMAMLEKKNDDLFLVKIYNDSQEFKQFKDLYKAEVLGFVTLFVVNNEGIPLTCHHVFKEEDVPVVVEKICKSCMLNSISATELTKLFSKISVGQSSDINSQALPATKPDKISQLSKKIPVNVIGTPQNESEEFQSGLQSDIETLPHDSKNKCTNVSPTELHSTQLQIRLPDGSRDKQKFGKDAVLNEVWVFVSAKYKLKDFDLKTYNHQVFCEEEYNMSLRDLDLYPNGVIIVVPKNVVSVNNNGWITTMVYYGFSQFMRKTTIVFHYIQGLFSMFWNSLFPSNNRQPTNLRRDPQVTSKDDSENSQSSQKRSGKSSKAYGTNNIHTLKRQDDSDEENNRYNGNSTQQK